MVFKPINLARQSFVKTFTHGYAQSLVAASQSSTATQNTSFHTLGNNVASLFGKTAHPSTPVTPYAHQHGASSDPAAKSVQTDAPSGGDGLAAYYAAWQRHRKTEDKELHQFQFAKRIGWKAPTTIPDARNTKDVVQEGTSPSTSVRPRLTRSLTASAVEDGSVLDQAETLDTTKPTQPASPTNPDDGPAVLTPSDERKAQDTLTAVLKKADRSSASLSEVEHVSPAPSTAPPPVSEGQAYTAHLALLTERQQYADIPAVFQSMLATGIKPTSSAYNALLLAAINLPRGKHQVASKVLDVYADMLNRRVLPDTSTYAIIVELLAARALDIRAMQQELSTRAVRYRDNTIATAPSFMLQSDAIESKILAEDDSLSIAIKLFDTSAAVTTNHVFPAETYRLLITACAEAGKIGDMVRIYADMESQSVVAPSAIFAPMISAFALDGDLRSAVECYNEYKALAIAHDNSSGGSSMVRKDEEIYAAVVKAYLTCQRKSGAFTFLDRLENSMADVSKLAVLRNTVAHRGLIPSWLLGNDHAAAMQYAMTHLTDANLISALSSIAADAADKDMFETATNAFSSLASVGDTAALSTEPVTAILAMHIRLGDTNAAHSAWTKLKQMQPTLESIEPTVLLCQSPVAQNDIRATLDEVVAMFSGVRNQATTEGRIAEASDRIEEAIDIIANHVHDNGTMSAQTTISLLRLIASNDTLAMALTQKLLAGIGPEQVTTLSVDDIQLLAQVEASMIVSGVTADIAHAPRFAHALSILNAADPKLGMHSSKLFEDAASKIGRPDLMLTTPNTSKALSSTITSPARSYSSTIASPMTSASGVEDTFDPYGYTTDFRGSAFIADELEKPYGKHSQHLNEALARFRNMRRAGRHPRYATYAKLITSAAKEGQLNTAEDILTMAKQDVPYVAQSRIVRQGWISILDSMVGACLTMGARDLAIRYHQDLISIDAAPSANTFGLYITTLKDSTKTFDEATEAVKIFHQAKNEGVEPSSFLYNALIGKLGKARRVDDCLLYFAEMRQLGIRPTSVTYGTLVNALCRVSDARFAEKFFEEMESMNNYKPRPAPYNSLMQFFLTTKRDRSKVLTYYERMKASNITPTMHTYKLLIDTYATLEPVNLTAAEEVIDEIKRCGQQPEAVHYASLIHAKGCVLHDMAASRAVFDTVLADPRIKPQACLYQALFESYVANHDVSATDGLLEKMKSQFVQMTPYIANTLIHGWAVAENISRARSVFESLGRDNREPSTYEAMIRAYLAVEDHGNAMKVVGEALRRGYPSAVADKLVALVSGGEAQHP